MFIQAVTGRLDFKQKLLTIEDREGSFRGMLNSRTIEVVWVTAKNPVRMDFERKADKTVIYNGKLIQVKM